MSSKNPSQQEPGGSTNSALLLAGISVVIAGLILFFWLGSDRRAGYATPEHLPSGPAEHSCAASIRIENISLSRAENYLHQEVTTLQGELFNTGECSLQRIELAIEFVDELNQVVLKHFLISSAPQPLAPKGARNFEVSFERLPSSWNRQSPQIKITGLELTHHK